MDIIQNISIVLLAFGVISNYIYSTGILTSLNILDDQINGYDEEETK